MAKTLFERIVDREIPASFVHEDEHCFAIKDINPQAPLHVLVIPRKPIAKLSDAQPEDQTLLGDFRLNVNNGAGAGQSVYHLHVHLIAGRPMKWPPG
jgi:histidine triad (HIT) family protein